MAMEQTEYGEALLRETREELAKADSKASILLAASGIAFAALLSLGNDSHWYPDQLAHHSARDAGWAALAFTLLGIICVGAAVKPRLRSEPRRTGRVDYFGDVVVHRPRWTQIRNRKAALRKGRHAYEERLATSATSKHYEERLVDQIWHLSHIADRKYRLISIGMWFFAAAALAATFALVVEKEWL